MNLAEALPKETRIRLADDKVYRFSEFHLNAQVAVEEKYNLSFLGLDDAAVNDPEKKKTGAFAYFLENYLCKKQEAVRFVAYQLLRKFHPELDEERLGYLITPANQKQVYQAVIEAYIKSLTIPEPIKKVLCDQVNQSLTVPGSLNGT